MPRHPSRPPELSPAALAAADRLRVLAGPLAHVAAIGRSGQGNTHLLPGDQVGDHHALVALDCAGRGWLVDLGSGCPTYLERDGEIYLLDGQPVLLAGGDRITIGDHHWSDIPE
jgi:hypothetical protein